MLEGLKKNFCETPFPLPVGLDLICHCKHPSKTMLVPAFFLSFYHNYTLRQTADTFETINRHLRGRLRVVPHFSLGIVEQVKRECAWKSPHARKVVEKNEGVQTKPKLLTLHGRPILACENRIPLPNQLSTSNGFLLSLSRHCSCHR